MSITPKFYRCSLCGNLVSLVKEGGGSLVCCNQPMTLLNPNSVDASNEKHVPAVTVEGNTVTVVVGSVIHPMLEEHHIEWIYLLTSAGRQLKYLAVGHEPKATFVLEAGETVVAAYEYCNLHGLWVKNV